MNAKNAILGAVLLLMLAAVVGIFVFSPGKGAKRRHRDVKRIKELAVEKPKPLYTEVVEKYPTGEVKANYSVYTERPDVKEGTWTEFYKGGAKKCETVFKENVMEGTLKFYYEDGTPAMSGTMKGGVRDGAFTEWHCGGREKIKASYVKGRLEGDWVEFYDLEGSPKLIEGYYKDGRLEGRYAQYKPDGSLKVQSFNVGAVDAGGTPAAAHDKDGKRITPPSERLF